MAGTVDLDHETVLRQVKIHDPVVRVVEALLETIGRSERSEEITEQQFRRGRRLAKSGDIYRVPFFEGKLTEIPHSRILTRI